MNSLIIEVRVNENEMRDKNPNVPWNAEEIAADAARCREAGAAVVHFHARMADGAPDTNSSTIGEVIKRIKQNSDILVHSTLGSQTKGIPIRDRLRPVLSLAKDPKTRPDLLPLCFSSPNWDFYNPETHQFSSADKTYINPTDELITSVQELNAAGVTVSCVSWDVGATRRIGALRDAGLLKDPIYMQFHLTSGGMLAGHPATAAGLDAHLAFLPQDASIEWGVINLHGTILPLAEKIIREGGHIHIGIGDYHYAEEGSPTNVELVARIVEIARRVGRDIASPEEVRSMLRARN